MRQSSLHRNTEPENKEYIFTSLKNEDYSDSFPNVEKWIREKSFLINQHNERKSVKMKNYIFAHKMRLVYTIIALAIIVGACSIPVVQNETIGHVLSWTLPQGASTDLVDKLPWIDKSKLSISTNNDNGKITNIYTLMMPGTTDNQVQAYQRDLEKIKDITSIKVFPLNENVKRPVYAAALNSFFRININATKMSDEGLSKEVERQLKEQGMNNVNLNVKTDENGRRQIQVKLDKNYNDKNPKDVELRINEGDNKEEVMEFVKKPLDQSKLKGKTDEEIRNYVREQLGNPEIKDNEITIIRDNNGEVRIEVDINKEDKK